MNRCRPSLRVSILVVALGVVTSVASAQCQLGRLIPDDASSQSKFGNAIAIDGDVAVIGASNDDTLGSDAGAAYVYRFNGSTWVEEAKLLASDGEPNDLFGHTVDVDGDLVVVGGYAGVQIGIVNGAAYVYRFDGTTWSEEVKLTTASPSLADFFGYSVAVSGDLVAVGDPGNSIFSSPPGQVSLFRYDGVNWNPEAVVEASDAANNDTFGWSIDLDGDRLLVGAPKRTNGGENRGGVYYFEPVVATWTETQLVPLISNDHDQLGEVVALQGSRAIASALELDPGSGPTGTGSILVFEDAGGNVWSETARLTTTTVGMSDEFGVSASLDADEIFVGAPGFDTSGGAIRFSYDGLAWNEVGLVTPIGLGFSDDYGTGVAVSNSRAIATAPRHDTAAINAGAMYVFDFETTPPVFRRGDANNDTSIDVGDAIWLLGFIFQDGDTPPCLKAGDANGDGTIDLGDAIWLINYAFLAGTEPPAPFPNCGVAPTPSPLCCFQSSCP